MRILFLSRIFPGRFRALAQLFAQHKANSVLFLAEKNSRDTLPGIRRLQLAAPKVHESQDPAEVELVQRLRYGARAGNALLKLRKSGFIPDLICAYADMGGSFYVRDVFPEAFYVAYGNWFFNNDASHTFMTRGKARQPADFAVARVCNLWEYNALEDCDLALTSFLWQRSRYPEHIANTMQVVHDGINTQFFYPDAAARHAVAQGADASGVLVPGCEGVRELVTFCAPPNDNARGFASLRQCLPQLLALRPQCQVAVGWVGKKEGEAPSADILGISEEQRARVHMLGALPLNEYRVLLQISTAHIYLAAPHIFSTGLLEAMACGCLVLGSDTPPVREVLRHGSNGFLCDFWDGGAMAQALAGLLERAADLDAVRQKARQDIVDDFDLKKQTLRLSDLIGACMDRWKADRCAAESNPAGD